jgi:hypothetical protein
MGEVGQPISRLFEEFDLVVDPFCHPLVIRAQKKFTIHAYTGKG